MDKRAFGNRGSIGRGAIRLHGRFQPAGTGDAPPPEGFKKHKQSAQRERYAAGGIFPEGPRSGERCDAANPTGNAARSTDVWSKKFHVLEGGRLGLNPWFSTAATSGNLDKNFCFV